MENVVNASTNCTLEQPNDKILFLIQSRKYPAVILSLNQERGPSVGTGNEYHRPS